MIYFNYRCLILTGSLNIYKYKADCDRLSRYQAGTKFPRGKRVLRYVVRRVLRLTLFDW